MVLLNEGNVAFSSIGRAEEDTSEATELYKSYFYSSLGKVSGRDVVM